MARIKISELDKISNGRDYKPTAGNEFMVIDNESTAITRSMDVTEFEEWILRPGEGNEKETKNLIIDAETNDISNLDVDDFASGILDTNLSEVAAAHTTIASAKAIKDYVDAEVDKYDTLEEMDDVTITTVASGQMLIHDSSGWVNEPITGDVTINASGVTRIANGDIGSAELGVTPGEATVSKALVVDANGDIDLNDGGIVAENLSANGSLAANGTLAVGGLSSLLGGVSTTYMQSTASSGKTHLTSTYNAAEAIKIHADAGSSQTIEIVNDEGIGSDAIDIVSSAGGVGIKAAKSIATDSAGFNVTSSKGFAVDVTESYDLNAEASISLNSSQNAADAIKIEASGTTGGIDINAGTEGIAVDTTGTISLGTTYNLDKAIDITTNGGSGEKILVKNTQGVDDDAIKLYSYVGGIKLDAKKAVDIESSAEDIIIGSSLAADKKVYLGKSGEDVEVAGDLVVKGTFTHSGENEFTDNISVTKDDPILELYNDADENENGGRNSTIVFSGDNSSSEKHTLAKIEASHWDDETTGDSYEGQIKFYTNDGDDVDPGLAMTITKDQGLTVQNEISATQFTGNVVADQLKGVWHTGIVVDEELTISGTLVKLTGDEGSLVTLSGGNDGMILILKKHADGTDITVVNTDNIKVASDFIMGTAGETLTLVKEGTNWWEIARVSI